MTPRFFPRGGGGGLKLLLMAISGAPTADPGDVVLGSAVATAPGEAEIVRQTPAAVSRLPSAMAVWEQTTLTDARGRRIVDLDGLDLGDQIALQAWADETAAPTDECLAVGLNQGAVNTTNIGVCVMLQASSGAWLVHHGQNTGAGWAYTAAGATNALTLGGQLQIPLGTTTLQSRHSAMALDASGRWVTTANAHTSLATANVGPGWDRAFAGVGWATGTGGTGRTCRIGAAGLIQRLWDLPAIRTTRKTASPAWPSVVRRIALVGDSTANGTVVTADDGAATDAGWTVRVGGANITTWPANTTGTMSALIDQAIAQGATSGNRYLIRRATNGSGIGATQVSHLAGLRDDVTALAVGDPDVLLWFLGANDAQDDAEVNAFRAYSGFERHIIQTRHEFPTTPILLVRQNSNDAVNYPGIVDGRILAEQRELVAAYPLVRLVDYVYSRTDGIHPDAAGLTGIAAAAALIWRGP